MIIVLLTVILFLIKIILCMTQFMTPPPSSVDLHFVRKIVEV